MKNTNSKEFNDALKAYLAPIIQAHAEDYGEPTPSANLYQWAIDTAENDVDYYYHEIIETAEKLHGCTLTEEQKDIVCEYWSSLLAAKLM